MIKAELLRDKGILVVTPMDTLEKSDFQRLNLLVDPYIQDKGKLIGILIDAESFPGWDDFASLLSHIRFIRNHEKEVERVAAVTDKGFLAILPKVADYFVAAELRHFEYQERDRALAWLESGLDVD